MNKSLGIILIVAALLSPFLFPYPATVILSFLAGVVFPPVALLVGLVADLVYFAPPASLPLGVLGGGVVTVFSFFVRRFIKARIIMG